MEAGLTHWVDILIIVIYFIGVLAVGLWTLCRPGSSSSVKGYFLAGRNMAWLPVGASLYASNIGSEHFIGLAGTGAASGVAIVLYEWMSLPLLIALAWLFLPVYTSAGVYTLPEYLQQRFGGQRLRTYLSVLSLFLYIATKIVVCIFAGGLYIQLALGWNMYLAITLLLFVTCIYTVLGGLAAVIYTDTLQTVIMTLGAIVLTAISFAQIDGYGNLEDDYLSSVPTNFSGNGTCGIPRPDAFHLLRDPLTADNPWPGLILQSSLGCLFYWCADQVIVQRVLAAKNLSHAKAGALFAGYMKIMPLFFMVFPGMISRILFTDQVGCVDPQECMEVCGNPAGCSNIAYPLLVMELMPLGVRGLLLAVMLSAITTSLTSIFNSASTLFTMDLWHKLRPRATQRELLIVGRLCIIALCLVSILWIPLVQSSAGGQLFVYIQAVQGYLGTPIGALFLAAVFWSKMTETGAFCGICVGHVCGTVRMVLDFVYPAPACGDIDTRPRIVSQLHYTYFSQMNFAVTVLVIVVVSLLTRKKDEQPKGVTWWNCRQVLRDASTIDIKDEDDGANTGRPKGKADVTFAVESQVDVKETSRCKAWCNSVCGVATSTQISPEQEDSVEDKRKHLTEKSGWKICLNVNALVAVGVMLALVGYYH